MSFLDSGPYFHNPLKLSPYAMDLDAIVKYVGAATEPTLARA